MKRYLYKKWSNFSIVLLLLLNSISTYTFADVLKKIEANSSKGFHWPYYLAIPSSVTSPSVLLVEPPNPPIDSDQSYTFDAQDQAAAERIDHFAFNLFKELGSPLLMPVFPRTMHDKLNNEVFYSIHLDKLMFTTSETNYSRLDLQLLSMIEDAREKLAQDNITIDNKIFIDGFSSSGIFVNRFVLLHPDIIRAAAIGGAGIYSLPASSINAETLGYPLGTYDITTLLGQAYNLAIFKEVPLYIYVGADDTNDSIGVLSEHDASLTRQILGQSVIERFNTTHTIYQSAATDGQFVQYADTGHELTTTMVADVIQFFQQHLVSPDIEANSIDNSYSTSTASPISLTVTLDSGIKSGQFAELWVTAETDFGTFSYLYPQGWQAGHMPATTLNLYSFTTPFELLNQTLPSGNYQVTFAIDMQVDGSLDSSAWTDTVKIKID